MKIKDTRTIKKMIDRKISIHLQDFPNLSFIKDDQDLVDNMDFVRAICSTALSIRDNKNLRVRLPLNRLTIIGKKASRALDFKDIIADEVNVKNIDIQEKIDELAEMKLQINFKKVGVKYGSKVKEIMAATKSQAWQKISENEIEIAGVNLVGDEFELKLIAKNHDDKKLAIMALPTNDLLISLDIEITPELQEEGTSRDIVRGLQQARKDADLNVSDRIIINLFSKNDAISQVAKKFADFIKDQVLALEINVLESLDQVKNDSEFFCESKIEDGDLAIGITKTQ